MVFKKKIESDVDVKNQNESSEKVNGEKKSPKLQKKIQKHKIGSEWNDRCRIVSLSTPQAKPSTTNKKFKYKYYIQLKFKDKNGKVRSKSVKFGKEKHDDLVDHKNRDLAARTMVRIKNTDNPLQPNYWRVHLLNTYNSISEAYSNYVNTIQPTLS